MAAGVHGRAGNLPSCTGAGGPRVLGKLVPGPNFAVLMCKVWGGGGSNGRAGVAVAAA